MEGLSNTLGIPTKSGIYHYAVDQYYRARPQLSGSKFSERCIQAACLLISSSCHHHKLEIGGVARRAGVPTKDLQRCLEMIAESVGGGVTVGRVCEEVGYPAVGPIAETILQYTKGTAVAVAASVHLALQSLGIRVAVMVICAAAYANPQHVQRYALEVKGGPARLELEKITTDEELRKRIKDEGRRQVKKSKTALTREINEPIRMMVPERELSFEERHYQHELGFAIAITTPSHVYCWMRSIAH